MAKAQEKPNTIRSKRAQLVEAALRLFEADGCHSTGIDRILEEAGVAKMTLYNHFKSKDDLILAALRLRDERFRHWLATRVDELADSPREKLLAVFDAADENFRRDTFNGCLFARASGEYADPEHPVRAAAKEHCRLMHRYLTGLATDAGAHDPEGLASAMMLLYTGAAAAAQMNACASAAGVARDAARMIIDASIAG